MPTCFFDTCALAQRYVGGDAKRLVSGLIGNHSCNCYISEFSILEMPSALGSTCRSRSLSVADYDAMNVRFFEDIAKKRIEVRGTRIKHVTRAHHLLRFGGVVRGRSVGSADALIAASALDLAHELKARVRFYTNDWRLFDVLRGVSAFTAVLELHYLSEPKDGGSAVA